MDGTNRGPAEHHRFDSPASHPWHRFVALGDSFTEGFGDPEPSSPGGYRGWADRVAEELSHGSAGFSYANLAIHGLTVQQVIEQQLGKAIELAPDLVTFQAGGNDLIRRAVDPDRMASMIEPAVDALTSAGARVLMFLGPDSGPQTVLGHIRSRIAIFNENLRAIAARHGAVVADLWALRALRDPRMWDEDRLHLSPLGHQTVAALVMESLNVEHSLTSLVFQPVPALSWRQARTGDLIWTKDYLVPWLRNGAARHPSDVAPAAKRPIPGPVIDDC